MDPQVVAQAQLDAYNARDIDAFLAPYDPEIVLACLPGDDPFARGHDQMRALYGKKFAEAPDLHCRLVNRICHDRFVVDQEELTGVPGAELIRAVAIYEVVDGLILRAWFLK